MDESENPCNDFYQFSCGGWINDSVIPKEKAELNTFTAWDDDLLLKVKTVLESNVTTKDQKANKMITKMRKFYKNWLDRDKFGPSSKLLGQLFSTVPLPYINQTGWLNQGKVEFEKFLADLALNDINVLLQSGVKVDVRNNTRRMFYVDQPPLTLGSREYFIEDNFASTRNEYKKLMERVLDKVYKDLNITDAIVDVDAIMALQIKIANATTPYVQRVDVNKTDNRWKVQRLVNSSNTFNFQKYLDQRMSILKSGKTLKGADIITVKAPEYFIQLEEMLNDSSKDTIGQLATFLLVNQFEEILDEEYRSIFADFRESFVDTRGDDTRWKQCAELIRKGIFKDVMSRIYSQQYFDTTSKTEALEMIAYIREAFYKLLEVNTWMDNATRQVAAKKAEKMGALIGYPDYVLNGTYLEEHYSEIPVNDGEYLMDMLKVNRINQDRMLKSLNEPVDKNRWAAESVVVNAFYYLSMNQIIFPMGILAEPFFDKDYPKYLNYGGIGAVIGHEITHGLDNRGRQRDENGNFRPWWPSSTVDNFKKATQCMIKQYGRYEVPVKKLNMTLNGNNTLGENIADNGGIKQSFKAYREWVEKRGKPEPKLPGLQYTPEQLFFINFSQVWCSKLREKVWRHVLNWVHTPSMYRIIGSLSNTPDFQEAFKCQPGDQMNPKHKCSVW